MIRRWVAGLGATPGEPADRRTLRIGIVTTCLAGLGMAAALAILSLLYNDRVMLGVNCGAMAFVGLSLAWFARHRRFAWLVWEVSIGTTATACLGTCLLGGITQAGGALQLAALGPVLVALCLSRRATLAMFALFVVGLGLVRSLLYHLHGAPPRLEDRLLDLSQIVNVIVLTAFIVFLMAYLNERRREAQAAFEAEHQRSEALLLNVLPPSIAERLKAKPEVIADSFDAVSILFADLVGFTALSATLAPARLVAILNDLFSRFDALCDRHGLEKIKTIGDAYLVVAGLPTPRADHAPAIADMALDMLAALHDFRRETGLPLDLRIGINSGPVVAGVIGSKKFIYDLWGDAVNVASRMESHGRPGAIHVASATQILLRDHYQLTPCGPQVIKGKGEMDTWLLVGRSPAAAPRSES